MALIEVKNVSKKYTDEGVATVALKNISLQIDNGEFLAIMGPSGSGKSTLLHILGFLDRPTKGQYRFEGKTIEDFSDDDLARVRNEKVGFIFQSFNLLPRVSVFENVRLPLLYSHVPPEQWDKLVEDAIESVGLSHRQKHEPAELSGGEKQRVAIARALVNNPSVVFADEPTGNLDSKSGQMIMEIIQKLNDGGKTIILITHETSTAKHAKRILNLKDGEILSDEIIGKRNLAKDGFVK